MKNKKKTLVITVSCVAAVAVAALGFWFFWMKDHLAARSASPVYVSPVASIVGLNTGASPRFTGVVEPQEIYKINKDETKTVSEILVKEGDEIHVGDVLFRYDSAQMQDSLEQAKIDQERIANLLSTLKSQLNTLNAEKKKANKDDQASYTLQIDDVQLQIKTQEYESQVKQAEIDKLQAALENTDVLSEVEGIVKSINNNNSGSVSGDSSAFINVLSSGAFRIKGTVTELNRDALSPEQPVVVRSRVDSGKSWNGVVSVVEQEPASDNNNMNYGWGMDTGEKSSKYNFYVNLENTEGLILGQHVYIETSLTSADTVEKEGLWLPAVYIVHDEKGSFVWAKDADGWLEKRAVMLGDYDTDNDMYQVKDGVSSIDALAYPRETLMVGMPTTLDATYQYDDTYGGNSADDSYGGAAPADDIYSGDLGGDVIPEDGSYAGDGADMAADGSPVEPIEPVDPVDPAAIGDVSPDGENAVTGEGDAG